MDQTGRLKYVGRGGIITDIIEKVNRITTMSLPVIGHVVCGSPEEAQEQVEGHIDFPIISISVHVHAFNGLYYPVCRRLSTIDSLIA